MARFCGIEQLEEYKVKRCLMSNESVVILFVLDLNWSEFIVSSVTGIFIYYHSHTHTHTKKVKKETRRKKYVDV